MTREEAAAEIKRSIPCTEYLEKSKGGLYCCPFCNSGHGSNATGAVKFYEADNKFFCHACNNGGDVIDLYRHKTGAGYSEALYQLAEHLGIEIDGNREEIAAKNAPESNKKGAEYRNTAEHEKSSTSEICAITEHTEEKAPVEYLKKRGISEKTAALYSVGYDKKTNCLIIPTSGGSYISRTIADSGKGERYRNHGKSHLFNGQALFADQETPVFIVEGAIDALSIIEAGKEATALNSTSNARKIWEVIDEEKKPCRPLVLCLDNDEHGKPAEDKLAEELERREIPFLRANIAGEYKDANEALMNEREAFFCRVRSAEKKLTENPDGVGTYLKGLFAQEIEHFMQQEERKTGFAKLDELCGGIYSGLYVLGAISSLGKTTFVHQIADQMAAAGQHVLYFSLEQSRLEMASKSLSRIVAKNGLEKWGRIPDRAPTSLSIRSGKRIWEPAVQEAYKEYLEKVGDRLNIISGKFEYSASDIIKYTAQYMKRNKDIKPVVVVDYLQILDNTDEQKRSTLRDAIDTSVKSLKQLSVKYDIPVFVISSFNRSNYLSPVDFESFKESGGIEYTADVVLGLQLQVMNNDIFNSQNKIKEKRETVRDAKAETPRKVQLVCLKNRYGISSYSVNFNYYPACDLFEETGEAEADKRKKEICL